MEDPLRTLRSSINHLTSSTSGIAASIFAIDRHLSEVVRLLEEAVTTDGEQHKQWYLEQIAERLNATLPEHDPGIAP